MFDNLRTRVRSTDPDRYLQNSLFLGTKDRKSTREHTHQPSSIAITCTNSYYFKISSNYFSVSFKPLIFSKICGDWFGKEKLVLNLSVNYTSKYISSKCKVTSTPAMNGFIVSIVFKNFRNNRFFNITFNETSSQGSFHHDYIFPKVMVSYNMTCS